MKYIRTEDGHIYEIETKEYGGIRIGCFKNANENFNLNNSLREWQLDCKNQYYLDTPNGHTVCKKQADTIEELCDKFVLATKINEEIINVILDNSYSLKNLKELRKSLLYGAIWTEWGLKYVAKMNEKGEFELL